MPFEKANQGYQPNTYKNQNYDPDTYNQAVVNLTSKSIGRKKAIINVSVDEFNLNPVKAIQDNMKNVIKIHNANVTDIDYLENYYKGKQDIVGKSRANGEIKINNKHVTNYAWEYVNFKKGYYVGKPIKYVDQNVENSDSIKYLNLYNRCIKKSSKDLVKYENMLISGIAHTMIIPTRNDYDTNINSPYEYFVLDNRDVCVVRANDNEKTQLYAVCFSKVNQNSNIYSEFMVYYDKIALRLDNKFNVIEQIPMFFENPITEYQLNEQRMGLFEPIISSLNSMNRIRSNQIDYLEELINAYLTFENVDTKVLLERIDEMRKKRFLAVQTNNPETPARIGSVSVTGDITQSNSTYNDIEQRTYDILGVPMPTSSTGQGVSGEAQVYGGGWENAQTIANVDTNYIVQYELDDLVKMLNISSNAKNSKTKYLNAYEIDIKYTINKSNNMLVKSQTFKYLRDLGVPFEQAFELSELTDDPHSLAKVSEENLEIEKRKVLELEVEKENRISKINNGNQETVIVEE